MHLSKVDIIKSWWLIYRAYWWLIINTFRWLTKRFITLTGAFLTANLIEAFVKWLLQPWSLSQLFHRYHVVFWYYWWYISCSVLKPFGFIHNFKDWRIKTKMIALQHEALCLFWFWTALVFTWSYHLFSSVVLEQRSIYCW